MDACSHVSGQGALFSPALLAAVQFPAAAAAPDAAPTERAAVSHTDAAIAPASLASVSAMPGQTGQQLAVAVAPGLQPARINGSIAVTGRPTSTIRVSAQGGTLLEAPAKGPSPWTPRQRGGPDRPPAGPALEYTPAVRDVCTANPSTATLNNVRLTTQAPAPARTSAPRPAPWQTLNPPSRTAPLSPV